MYDIDLQKDREHVNSYYYKSKNEYGQIITLEIYEIYKEPGFMNVTFYIATKRKNGFQENLIVGKDGMKSLSWTKQCLMNFINNNIWKNFLKGKVLLVYPANNRLRRIYERSLIPIGFKVAKNKDKPLYLKLI